MCCHTLKEMNATRRSEELVGGFYEDTSNPVVLQMPKVVVDGDLRENFPFEGILPNKSFCLALCGPPGSGKSSLMTAMLTGKGASRIYRGVFDQVLVACPQQSLQSLGGDGGPFSRLPEGQHFEDLDEASVSEIIEMCKETRADGGLTLLIIDDLASSLKKGEISKGLMKLALNRRHYQLSIMICLQSLNALPLICRKAISYAILFRPTNKREALSCFEELVSLPRDNALALMAYAYQKPHDFLSIDMNPPVKIFRNFNRISGPGLGILDEEHISNRQRHQRGEGASQEDRYR